MKEFEDLAGGLTGRVALVTGGSRGIGKAVALALAGRGADVALTYQHSEERAAGVVDQIKATGAGRWRSGPTPPTRRPSPRPWTRRWRRSAGSTSW